MLFDAEQSLLAQGVHAVVLEATLCAYLREGSASKARACRGIDIDMDTS